MKIIPVLDICQGQVVHAKHGQRQFYKPVKSRLCAGSDPITILQAFLDIYPFDIVYIADLDAINCNGNNLETIKTIIRKFVSLTIWLDVGTTILNLDEYHQRVLPVLGSETGITLHELQRAREEKVTSILSLDYKDGILMGDVSIADSSIYWPDNVIVLNLSRVGSNSGPDIQLINSVIHLNRGKRLFYGGGVRHGEDLDRLKDSGLTGVLLATLLHTQMMDYEQIAKYVSGPE